MASVVDSFDISINLKINEITRRDFPWTKTPNIFYTFDDFKRLGHIYKVYYSFLDEYSIFIVQRDSTLFIAHHEGESLSSFYIINKQLVPYELWPWWPEDDTIKRPGYMNPINFNKMAASDIIKGKLTKEKAVFVVRFYFNLMGKMYENNNTFLVENYLQIPHGKGMPIDSTNPVLNKPIDILSDQYHKITLEGDLPDSLSNIIKPLIVTKKDETYCIDCFTWLLGELFKCRLDIDVTGIREIHVKKIGENIGTWSFEL